MKGVFKRQRFSPDLAEELAWLNEKAGATVADRWYQAFLGTIDDLSRNPHLGRERLDLKPAGIRSWRVKRFPRWLIFYMVLDGDLILLRVQYGTMNPPGINLAP
jgi:plasmid stabilization system protein ParE